MKSFLFRVFCGFSLGMGVFAPGVSGSVLAIILGIYEKLIDIISNPFKEFKKNVVYLIPMGIGAAISFVLFILFFSHLFDHYERATYFLFMGLIAGNLPVIYREANMDGFKKHYVLGVLPAFALSIIVSQMQFLFPSGQFILSNEYLLVGFSGLVSGIASLIPGMSISMILMLFGVYNRLMHAAKSLEILPLAITGVCFLLTMVASSRLIKHILKRYHNFAYFMVLGFMAGSLVGIFMNLPPAGAGSESWLAGLLMLGIGLGVSLSFTFAAKKHKFHDFA